MAASTLYDYYTGQGQALPSLQQRATIYEQQGLGAASTYGGTAEQNTALLGKLQTPTASTTPAPISATGLNTSATPMNVLPYTEKAIPSIDPVMAAITAAQKTAAQDVTGAQADQTSTLATIKELFDKKATEGQRKIELGAQEGLPALKSQLNEINNQIRDLTGQAFSAQQTATNRHDTEFAILGEQAAIQRQLSARTFGLAAASQALQGNIALAQDNIARALDAEFGGIESQIEYQSKVLDLNRDKLSSAQQKQADLFTQELESRKQQLQIEKDERTAVLSIVAAAAQNRAPNAILNQAVGAKTQEEALQLLGQYLQAPTSSGPASVQEYEYAVQNGYTGSFTDYQNEDANRKRSIAAAGVANESGLNPKQVTIFNSIVDKYNKSPLVAANDRAVILKDVTDAVSKDPTNASLQVSFIYSMIQALDTYQSAVREGEIGLISNTQGLGDKLANLPNKIQNGTPLSPAKINEYVATARLLTNSISSAAAQKKQSFASQANIAGVGDAFNEFANSGTVSQNNQQTDFTDIQQHITTDKNGKAYLPRSIWQTLGARQDALLAEAQADGFELLITD